MSWWGIEGRAIFRDDPDHHDFVRRVGEVAGAKGPTGSAWAGHRGRP
jgi:hypothetical protein